MILEDALCQTNLNEVLVVLSFIEKFELLFSRPEVLDRLRSTFKAVLQELPNAVRRSRIWGFFTRTGRVIDVRPR